MTEDRSRHLHHKTQNFPDVRFFGADLNQTQTWSLLTFLMCEPVCSPRGPAFCCEVMLATRNTTPDSVFTELSEVASEAFSVSSQRCLGWHRGEKISHLQFNGVMAVERYLYELREQHGGAHEVPRAGDEHLPVRIVRR